MLSLCLHLKGKCQIEITLNVQNSILNKLNYIKPGSSRSLYCLVPLFHIQNPCATPYLHDKLFYTYSHYAMKKILVELTSMHGAHSLTKWNSFLRFVGSLEQIQILDGPPHITLLRVNGVRLSFPVMAGVQSLHYACHSGEEDRRLLSALH